MSDDLIFAISNSPLMVTVVGAKPVLWFPSPCCNRACCADVTVLLILKPGESYRSFDVMPGSTSLAATISVLLRLRDEAPTATGSGKSPIRGPAG